MNARALAATLPLLAALALPAAAAAAPVAVLDAGPNPAQRGEPVTADVRIHAAVGTPVIRWAIDGKAMSGFDDLTELSGAFAVPGRHVITVRVGDDTTAAADPVQASRAIDVLNAAPVAAISLDPPAPVTGQEVTISSASTDADGDPLACAWDFDGDGVADRVGCSITRTFAKAASFTAALRVTDGFDTATATRTVTIADRPPVARLAVVTPAPETGRPVRLDGRGSLDPDGTIAAGAWDLDGDGRFGDAAGPLASVTFDTPGVHRVSLRVTDDDGATAVASADIAVAPAEAPVAQPSETPAPVPAAAPAPAKIPATLRYAFMRSRATTMFTSLLVRHLPAGATVRARCRGGGCARRTFVALARSDNVSLRTLIRRRLRPGAAITVLVTKPGMAPSTIVVTVRKGKDPKVGGR